MFQKFVTIVCVWMLGASMALGQDVAFSQFVAMPMNVNPALTGIAYGPRVNLAYRNEWPAIDKGFVSYGLSFDQHIEKINSGFGFLFTYDRVADGLLNGYQFRVNYAYQIRLGKGIGMQIGAYAGYANRSVNWTRFTFNDQIDPIFGFTDLNGLPNPTAQPLPTNESVHMFDAGAGFVLYNKIAYGGFAFSHITTPEQSFTDSEDPGELPLKTTIHGGVVIDITPKKRNTTNYISPNLMFLSQGGSTAINAGSYINIWKVFLGGFFRYNIDNPDAVIAVVGTKIEFVRIAYSYDITVSKLEMASGGAHEVTLSINWGDDTGPLSPSRKTNRVDCPPVLGF